MTQPRKATWPATLLKRNGREVPFDPGKIERAIAAAGQATGEFDPQQAQALAERVVERLPERACLDIERVQDLVERVLMEAGHYPTRAPTWSTANATAGCAASARPWWTSPRR